MSYIAAVRIALMALITASCVTADGNDDAQPTAGEAIAFVGVDVIPMTGSDTVLPDRMVVVRDGRIKAIEAMEVAEVPDGAPRIDGDGRFLMPGLADMHVHLEYFDDPGTLALFIANGVTTVRNMDGRPNILAWKRAIAAGELLGPTIITAGPLLDGDPPILPDNMVVRGAEEARAEVSAQDSAGYDFIKVYTNLSGEAYDAAVERARDLGMPVAGHVPREVGIDAVLRSGQASIEHLGDFDELLEADESPFRGRWHWARLYLAIPVDSTRVRHVAERVARAGVWTVPTLVQAERALAPEDMVRAWLESPGMAYIPAEGRDFWEAQSREVLDRMDAEDWRLVERGTANRKRLVRALHDAGAGLLIGTDTPNPFVVPGFSVHEELANFVDAGLTPADALASATRDAAQFLGELNQWGTVEVGKRADLLLLDDNPLEGIDAAASPAGVMLHGRWLPRDELANLLSPLRAEDRS